MGRIIYFSWYEFIKREAHGIQLVSDLDAGIADGLQRLLDAGFEPPEVGVGVGLGRRLGDIDGPGEDFRVRDADFDSLGDEREVLVSDGG